MQRLKSQWLRRCDLLVNDILSSKQCRSLLWLMQAYHPDLSSSTNWHAFLFLTLAVFWQAYKLVYVLYQWQQLMSKTRRRCCCWFSDDNHTKRKRTTCACAFSKSIEIIQHPCANNACSSTLHTCNFIRGDCYSYRPMPKHSLRHRLRLIVRQ